ncbi:MAG TPA: (2Fe-2S)-binding protein [Acidimicrobiales bacterium]|nr:(2Fe-2S)-binding protein [Acidimicrobiales bacterium]
MRDTHSIAFRVNGRRHELTVESRRTLVDVLRHDLGYTGTHVGCEHGICGACTVLVDGAPVRSCLMFGVQADGRDVETVEGLGQPDALGPLQEAFSAEHGLQCGFCTPGFLMLLTAFLRESPAPSDDEIREVVASNLCRCTGYQGILRAARAAVTSSNEVRPPESGTS